MLNKKITKLRNNAQRLTLACLLLTSLLVTPAFNYEPIILPKFFILIFSSLAISGFLVTLITKESFVNFKMVFFAVAFFVMGLFAVLFYHGFSLLQFYGEFGRNTGFLAYLSFVILFLSTLVIWQKEFAMRILNLLVVVSSINALYGVIQLFGLDPIVWINPYNPFVGTLGNPNFASALLGMGALVILSKLLSAKYRVGKWIFFYGTLLTCHLGVALFSDSFQGIGIFVVGASIICYQRFIRKHAEWFRSLFLVSVIFVFVLAIASFLQKGPFAKYLYQESITFRGDYWRAALNMFRDNLFLGVGLDRYGSYYREYRTNHAFERRADVVSSSAHNIFLDMAASGGLVLLLSYSVITLLVVRSAIRIVTRMSSYDFVGIALVSSWTAFVIQSVVSVNHIALAVWGWVLGAAIIGYESSRPNSKIQEISKSKLKRVQVAPFAVFIFGAVGATLGYFPLEKDVSFQKAIESSSADAIESAARKVPLSVKYINVAGQIFVNNGLSERASSLLGLSFSIDNRNYEGWLLILEDPKADPYWKAQAKANIKKLDPNFKLD
jgi:O-antigen ligase